MNIQYISGFFDADGSVSLISNGKGKNKTTQLSFSNCEKSILESIQKFLFNTYNAKGHISIKKKKKENHTQNYELKYIYQNGLIVANALQTIHPKKVHRIKVLNQLQECTPRNGKYTEEQKAKRKELEDLFFKH